MNSLNPVSLPASYAFTRLINPHNRAEVWQALTDFDVAEHAFQASRVAQIAAVQICGGVAIGLFPYTPGIIDSCNPHHNPGWLCAARGATLLAASGATIVGLMVGANLYKTRNWLSSYRDSLAMGLRRGSSPTVEIASNALKAYSNADLGQRRQLKESVWSSSPATSLRV